MNRVLIYAGTLQLFLISQLLSSQSISSNKHHPELSAKLDRILDSAISQQQIPGAVLLVSKNGKVLHHRAYGYAQLRSNDSKSLLQTPLPMSTEHLFDIASLTKVVATTTAILFLADRGLINLDTSVGHYIAGFAIPEKKSITVRHLLTHTSGLYEWYPLYYKASNRQEVYQLIAKLPLAFPVGQQRKYSDLGFTILGQLIEIVTKKPLEQFLEEEVFQPLGMKHTMYNPKKAAGNRKYAATSIGNPYEYRMVHDSALGFQFAEVDPNSWNQWRNYNLIGEVNDGNAWYAGRGVSGAAGIFSTAKDLNLLAQFWLNKGKRGNKAMVRMSSVCHFLTKDQFQNGLGWMMDPSNSFMKNAPVGSFGHTGFTGTSIVVIPVKGLVIVLLINRQQKGLKNTKEYENVNEIRKKIFSEALSLF